MSPFALSIDAVIRETGTRYPREMQEALTGIKERGDKGFYFQFIPSLEETGGDRAGDIAGEVLCDLSEWCRKKGIPELNMLIARKDTGLPGSGILEWYREKFGSYSMYAEYCDLHARLAKLAIANRLVEIVD